MSQKLTQKHITAGKIVAGGSVDYKEEYHHHYAQTDFAEIDELIKGFQKDCENNSGPKTFIEDLLHLSKQRENEKVIGLEAKLKLAGRDDDFISTGQEMKELFAKKLHKHQFSESAQKIYLYLLNYVATQFQFSVLPHIKAGAPPADIDRLINTEIVQALTAKLGPHRFVLEIYSREIAGMLFLLTGNCHLNWAKQC
jgi:hypothetical protein